MKGLRPRYINSSFYWGASPTRGSSSEAGRQNRGRENTTIESRYCGHCGTLLAAAKANFCGSCGAGLYSRHAIEPQPPAYVPSHFDTHHDAETIRRIADYERVSAILWMILGIVQILSIVAIIAGVWNVFAAWSRFRLVPFIRDRDSRVPAAYEGVAGLVIIGLINLLLGGLIGVLFITFDFIIRDKVLSNRRLFNNAQHSAAL